MPPCKAVSWEYLRFHCEYSRNTSLYLSIGTRTGFGRVVKTFYGSCAHHTPKRKRYICIGMFIRHLPFVLSVHDDVITPSPALGGSRFPAHTAEPFPLKPNIRQADIPAVLALSQNRSFGTEEDGTLFCCKNVLFSFKTIREIARWLSCHQVLITARHSSSTYFLKFVKGWGL